MHCVLNNVVCEYVSMYVCVGGWIGVRVSACAYVCVCVCMYVYGGGGEAGEIVYVEGV